MKIYFKSGVVHIKLIDNEFVNDWKDKVSKMEMINTWNENLFPEATHKGLIQLLIICQTPPP